MSFDSAEQEFEGIKSIRAERIMLSIFLIMIAAFMILDIADDWNEGIRFYHIIPEVLVAIFGMGSAGYLFSAFLKSRHKALDQARDEVTNAKKLAAEWRLKAASFRQGLSQAISDQLKAWSLTPAEQEICFLLLKGFSLQEIANLRQTSERTVRQQASIIYKKSGLPGRIQLAAFFLEDFLAIT